MRRVCSSTSPVDRAQLSYVNMKLVVALMLLARHFAISIQENSTVAVTTQHNGWSDAQRNFVERLWRMNYLQKQPKNAECNHIPDKSSWTLQQKLKYVAVNSTVIISNVNEGYLDFAANFWMSYRALGRSNIFFFTEDCLAFNSLGRLVGWEHVGPPFTSHSSSGAASFNTPVFKTLTQLRPFYMHLVLRNGLRALWQDLDSVPLRDILPKLPQSADLVVANDGSSDRVHKKLCSCLIYLKPTSMGWYMLYLWLRSFRNEDRNDQISWNRATAFARKEGRVRISVLPVKHFPNGQQYEQFANTAYWAHANYRTGKEAKLLFFTEENLWFSTQDIEKWNHSL